MDNQVGLNEFVQLNKVSKEVNIPYDGHICAGKNTYVYDAHTYHTKVPPEGIEPFIKYYTNIGDVILDPFCGSGMTGIAAQRQKRKVILSDLSPAATFIADNLNSPINADEYMNAVNTLLGKSKSLERLLYSTECRECGKPVNILYTVWSYGAICPICNQEFAIWDVARDERETVKESKILSEFDCPFCNHHLKKRDLKRTDLYPVAIGYKCCAKSLKERVHPLSDIDKEMLRNLTYNDIPANIWYPENKFPIGINTKQPIAVGIDSVDKAYFTRALYAYAFLWNEAMKWPNEAIRKKLLFTLTSLYQRITKFSEFRFWGGSSNTANYNVPHIINEQNVFRTFERKAKTIYLYFQSEGVFDDRNCRVFTSSACSLPGIPDNSIDYIFTDPPFGANINYSEMNFLWESWLQNYTDNTEEAIVNRIQGKDTSDYGHLLSKAFIEMKRVLKKDAWLTVMFHNSSDKIWRELQTAITSAGFEIKGILTFDKKHGTFKQFVSENAVGYDLVLNCQATSKKCAIREVCQEEEYQDIRVFLKERLKQRKKGEYTVHYEHVNRKDEFNFRKLYSEWLSLAVEKEKIAVNFERFRKIIQKNL